MKREKIILLMLMITMGILVLSACSGREEEKEVPEQKKESSADIGQFADEHGDMWRDSWEQDTASGDSVIINLMAQIQIPKMAQMSTVEVQRYAFSQENKKKVAEAVFDGDVYCYDDEHPASEDIVKVKEDYKRDDYTGEREGVRYNLSFDSDETSSVISMGPCDRADVYPKEIEGEKESYFHYAVEIEWESDNKCGMTKEEAGKAAKEFLQKAGFSDLTETAHNPLKWQNEMKEGEGELRTFINGWVFTYSPGVGDVAFLDYVEFNDGEKGNLSLRKENEDIMKKITDKRFSPKCSIMVTITDQGVIGVQIENPIIVMSDTPGVKLLPMEEIKKIIRNGMGEYTTFIRKTEKKSTMNFNRLTLGYYRVSDPDHKDRYTYIPAWGLWNNSENIPSFVVNAMDGSVIQDWGEKWEVTYKTVPK